MFWHVRKINEQNAKNTYLQKKIFFFDKNSFIIKSILIFKIKIKIIRVERRNSH